MNEREHKVQPRSTEKWHQYHGADLEKKHFYGDHKTLTNLRFGVETDVHRMIRFVYLELLDVDTITTKWTQDFLRTGSQTWFG